MELDRVRSPHTVMEPVQSKQPVIVWRSKMLCRSVIARNVLSDYVVETKRDNASRSLLVASPTVFIVVLVG